uniref:Vitellogenin 2 n=1 Tax=Tetraodon nigroviridis TaxID=99883 RepID=H3BVT1_TETNG
MRVTVLALALALVVGSQATAPYFASDNTYVYSYEARILGGLPEEGLARAGLKIRCKVLIRKANDALFNLSEPEILEYSDIWPKDAFSPATKLTTALATQLSTPIKFEYANGLVGKVYAPAGVSATVVNIHRGILNVLQINIKKNQNVYDLQEPGSQGVCKTHYIVNEDRKAERVLLIKTRDLSHCNVYKVVGLAYTHRCPECEATGKSLNGASTFSYVLKPTAQGSLIMMATSEELIQFSPFNILKGAAQMESRQILKFLNIVKTPLEPVRADYVPRGSLQYEFGSELLQMPIQLLRITNAEAQIVEILNHLVNFNVAKVHEDAPLKFIELIQVLRVVQFKTIEELWERFKAKPDYRNWILHAIPAIGSHTAVRLLKEKFIAGELTIPEAAQALIASVHMVTADIEVIKLFEGLSVHAMIRENPVLREVVMLGYGTLVAKYCAENPSCPAELVRPIHEIVIQALDKVAAEELILGVKVLGNAGHPGSLKTLMKLLPSFGASGTRVPHRVHVEAALALRNIAKKEPRMVQNIAVQLFMDKTLHAELRIAATIVLFETKLPMGLVVSLAKAVLKEENMQVASFVYSYMKAMTKNTTPDYASVAVACNVAVKLLSPRFNRLSHRYSRALYLDAYYSPWMMGAAASAFYINEAATVLPKTIVAKARTYLAGAFADVIEVGVRTEGVQEALLKMNDQNTQRIDKIKQIVQALAGWRASPSSQPLGSLYVKLFGQEVAFANIDKAVVDQVIEFARGPAISSYGRMAWEALLSGFKMHLVKPMLVAEIRRIFPTAAGLPMELSFYTAGVAAATVECQGTVTPPLPKDFHASQLLNSEISMRAAIAPSASLHTYAVMGINTAFIQAAVLSRAKVYTVLPAKVQAKLNMVKGNFKFDLLPVQAVDKIASAYVDTYAVARNVEDISAAKLTPILPDQASLELKKHSSWMTSSSSSSSRSSETHSSSQQVVDRSEILKGYESKLCKEFETYGIKVCADIETHNAAYIRNSLLYAIIGRHAAWIQLARASGPSIENIEIEIQVGDKAAEKVLKTINLSEEEEVLEDKTVLMKLQKILIPGLKNSSSSSSSSSRSSSSSSASKPSSSSSSHHKSKMVDVNSPIFKKSKKSSSSSSRSSVLSRSSSSKVSSSQHGGHSTSSNSSRSSSMSKREHGFRAVSRSSSSSSASNLASLFSASSSSSHWRSRVTEPSGKTPRFIKNHRKQTMSAPSSRSSRGSFQAIYEQTKFLGKQAAPTVAVIARAVRGQAVAGYQLAVYFDKPTARIQVVLADLASENHYKMCVDAVVLSKHKVTAKVGYGVTCEKYTTTITAETGLVGPSPAARLRVGWNQVPAALRYAWEKAMRSIPISILPSFDLQKNKYVANQVSFTIVAPTEKTLNIILKTPMYTISKMDVPLPISLPISEIKDLTPFDDIVDKITFMVAKAMAAAECSYTQDTLTTFNNRKYKPRMPLSCYQVLAQDCTDEMKFTVLIKNDHVEQKHINVKIADIDIDLFPKSASMGVKVNGREIPVANLPYQHPKVKLQIRQKGEGISVYAPSLGLHEVYIDRNTWRVQVVDWMKGQTCGLCGRADGETMQEFRTPSGFLTKNPVTSAHSWILPAESCRGTSATECRIKLESVELEKQAVVYGQDSKCFSVQPVLRCLPGCFPVKTASVTVGFHCVAAESNLNKSEVLRGIHEKSVDLREKAEAHLACSCTAQCV